MLKSPSIPDNQRKHSGLFWVVVLTGAFSLGLLHLRYSLSVVIGSSMLPTFRSGDLLLVDKAAYARRAPRREDVVLGSFGNDVVVKRIVGLPGEQVEVIGGELYIDDKLISEDHCRQTRPDFNISRGKMFSGRFATIGDNRAVDPRNAVHPILSKEQINGRIVFSVKLWPFRDKEKTS